MYRLLGSLDTNLPVLNFKMTSEAPDYWGGTWTCGRTATYMEEMPSRPTSSVGLLCIFLIPLTYRHDFKHRTWFTPERNRFM